MSFVHFELYMILLSNVCVRLSFIQYTANHDLVKQWSYKCVLLCNVSLLMLLCASLLPLL